MVGLKGVSPYGFGRFVRDRRDRSGHGPKWLMPVRRQAFLEFEDAWAWKRSGSGPRWWRSFTDTAVWGPHRELRLEYLRHRAVSAGIRWGSPLYDEALIDFCSRLEPEIAFDPRVNRPLVREALSDLLPDVVRLQTRKANFSAFAVQTMQADAAGLERLLFAPGAEIGAYIDLGWLRQRWRSGDSSPDPMSPFWGALWRAADRGGMAEVRSRPGRNRRSHGGSGDQSTAGRHHYDCGPLALFSYFDTGRPHLESLPKRPTKEAPYG